MVYPVAMVVLIACATFICTLLGGALALRFKDKLHLILGFSAGAVIGVALFDLLPESLELGTKYFDVHTVTALVAVGFLLYLLLDRVVFLHAHAHDDHEDARETSMSRGILGASSLSIHSFLDGVAIGLAFQVSAAIGAIVAIAVIVHDFSDGINTVSLILKNQGDGKHAYRWLIADAVAPVLGAASTLLFSVPPEWLSVILAIFSGFFLYIGASDLIPESHHAHPKFLTTGITLAGAAVLYLAIHFANI